MIKKMDSLLMAWEVMVSCYFVLILFSLFSFSNFLNFLFHFIASRVSGRANVLSPVCPSVSLSVCLCALADEPLDLQI